MRIRNIDLSEFEDYDGDYNEFERPARRAKDSEKKHKAKQAISEIAEAKGLEDGFKTTYQPARYEEGYLRDALKPFYDEELIVDVLSQVKGGKEASVYCCKGSEFGGAEYFAAKVYRPQQFRNLGNDRMYREGREILNGLGKAVKPNETRITRALNKKTKFGEEVRHTSWLMYEYATLTELYKAGASVPQPVAVGDTAILMSYYGEPHRGAPTLNEVHLQPKEAKQLFEEVINSLEIMLARKFIHGDLSAYNILYWEGKITIIDFPQVVSPDGNPNAQFIFQRDIIRVCEYFNKQGVEVNGLSLAKTLWKKHLETAPETEQMLEIAPNLK